MDYRTIEDTGALLDAGVRREAAGAEADAIIAEIEFRQWEILDQLAPGRPDIADLLKSRSTIAADRRRRADGIRKRAKVKDASELGDYRLDVVTFLNVAETGQIMLEEKLEHVDVYAVGPEELNLPRGVNSPPPQTAVQIELDAMTGRARVQALREWLEAHPGPAPEESPDPMRQTAVGMLKLFLENGTTTNAKKK